jgi:hypothetical protein
LKGSSLIPGDPMLTDRIVTGYLTDSFSSHTLGAISVAARSYDCRRSLLDIFELRQPLPNDGGGRLNANGSEEFDHRVCSFIGASYRETILTRYHSCIVREGILPFGGKALPTIACPFARQQVQPYTCSESLTHLCSID